MDTVTNRSGDKLDIGLSRCLENSYVVIANVRDINPSIKIAVNRAYRLFFGLSCGLFLGISYGLFLGMSYGLTIGLFGGLTIGLIYRTHLTF